MGAAPHAVGSRRGTPAAVRRVSVLGGAEYAARRRIAKRRTADCRVFKPSNFRPSPRFLRTGPSRSPINIPRDTDTAEVKGRGPDRRVDCAIENQRESPRYPSWTHEYNGVSRALLGDAWTLYALAFQSSDAMFAA